jgi:hypothetical protein
MRILTNYHHNQENISFDMQINITNFKTPSIISTKNYSLIIHFNKLNLLIHSNKSFLKIYENILLNQQIPIFNRNHYCLNNHSKDFILIDPTETFKIDQKLNLILQKYLNVKQQNIYHLTLQQKQDNYTNQVRLYTLFLKRIRCRVQGGNGGFLGFGIPGSTMKIPKILRVRWESRKYDGNPRSTMGISEFPSYFWDFRCTSGISVVLPGFSS